MERRLLFSGIILVVSISALIVVFFLFSKNKNDTNPLKSIPQDAAIILKLDGFDLPLAMQRGQNKIWNDFNVFQSIVKLNKTIEFIDTLSTIFPNVYELIDKKNIYLSGHISGNKKIDYLITLSAANILKEKELVAITTKYKKFIQNSSERKYEGKSIHSLKLNSDESIYYTLNNGLLQISYSPIIIEDAIRQSTLNGSLLTNDAFSKMVSVAGDNKEANLFIDLKQISSLFSLFSSKSLLSGLKDYNSFGNWVELDFNLKDDLFLLNGFASATDSGATFMNMVTNLDPVRITIDEVLPASVSFFVCYGISSPSEYYNNYIKYIKATGKFQRYIANLENMNSSYNVSFDEFFLKLLGTEVCFAYKDINQNNQGANYILLKCNSGSEAQNKLKELSNSVEKIKGGNLFLEYSPDNKIKFPIFKLPVNPFMGWLLGDFFDVFEENYLFVIDNYIVIAGSYKDASEYIHEYILQKTLSNDVNYRNFAANLSSNSYLLTYINLARSQNYFEKYLNESILKDWGKNISCFQKTQTAGIQISSVSKIPYLNIILNHYDDFRDKPRTVWESLLDSTLSYKPAFVLNHYTKQNEIVLQDDKNNLYLLNQSGIILWKTHLNERINSEIYQIDYFKNGKLQFLFSTESQLHMIDRNGNYVERYPINLRAKATTGMSLFDYESDKNYRIIIPCVDKRIYAYSKEGNLIDGWQFEKSDYTVSKPVEYYRTDNLDYLIFGDKIKTYILNRRGEARVNPEKQFSKSKNNTYYFNNLGNAQSSYFITTDTTGVIMKIFISGKVEQQNIGKFSSNHFFDLKDIDADGKNDYIFLDEKELSVYHADGKLMYKYTFDSEITIAPVYYHFSYSDRKIGVVDNKSKLIYLLNNNGKLYNGFPLEGTTQFTIGYFDITSSRFNLIVGGRNNFLYNYTVE